MKALVDCNSFYCSCECVFRPELHGSPVVVLSNNDGCIVSRNDEAKRLGIGMAAPYFQNKELIEKNNVATFSSNYSLYGELSMRVMDTLRYIMQEQAGQETVEVYSVDECFINMEHVPEKQWQPLAKKIVDTVLQWTGIPVSIGIAPTKTLAKVANRLSKKNKLQSQGIMIIDTPEKIRQALMDTSVADIWGVGRQYAKKLQLVNILTAWDLRNLTLETAQKQLGGVVGLRLVRELRGEPCIEMQQQLETKKMIATTRMFGKPVTQVSDLKEAVATYASRAAEKLRRQQCAAHIINVFLVRNDLNDGQYVYNPTSHSLQTTLPQATSLTNELIKHALPLVDRLFKNGSRYTKAGIILSGIVPDSSVQGNLFEPPEKSARRMLMAKIDNINFSMRNDMVKFASAGTKKDWKMRQALRSPRYTTRWDELCSIK